MSAILKSFLFLVLSIELGAPCVCRAETPAVPVVFLSLRGAVEDTIQVGEPLFVAIRIEAPDDPPSTLELAPASGTWADAIELTLGDSRGVTVARAHPVEAPVQPTATLGVDVVASGVWYFSSVSTAALMTGDYLVTAKLLIRDGRGWTGNATSEPITLHTIAPSESSELILRRSVAKAKEALATNRPEDAATIIDALLAQKPDTISLLTLRAIISARGGDLTSARLCINRAMDKEDQTGAVHPSISLFNLDQQLTAALSAPNPPKGPYPVWATPPMPLLRVLMGLEDSPSNSAGMDDATHVISVPPTSSATVVAEQPIVAAVVSANEITEAAIRGDPAGQ